LSFIGLTLRVEDIYERVNNEDMVEWLAKKALEAQENQQQESSP
jgi:hypothetical protein